MLGRCVGRRGVPRPLRVVGALAGVLALTVMSMVIPSSVPSPVAHAATSSECPTQGPCTKTLTASGGQIVDGKGHVYKDASVTVSQTENLQQRQVLRISWQGFQPSSNVPFIPPGERETNLIDYPVVLVECWGTDTPAAPMDPTHCQGPVSYWLGGHRLTQLQGQAIYAMTNDKGGAHGGVPNPTDVSPPFGPAGRGGPDILGFTAVDGTHYKMEPSTYSKGTDSVPPSLQWSSDALPANSVVASSDASGSAKNVEFEVRGGSDLPVLGCSYRQACTLEVIPIVRPWCDPSLAPTWAGYGKQQCTREPFTDSAKSGISNPFLSSENWWLGSHWKNRFAFPLNMAPQPNECSVVDQRPTVAMQGSEAATNLMNSWNQHFCLDPKSTFKLTHTISPESTARTSLTNGAASGIFTSVPVTGSQQPVVHAPVAVTGWTVAYALDQQDPKEKVHGRYTDLTLSPLLLAKLMTESYSGWPGREPALSGNPTSLFEDPEFKALNPGLYPPGIPPETGVVWDLNDSDAFTAMFAYIDADPMARAWLNGKPDPYSGMVVNPAYRGLAAPQTSFQLKDGWVQHAPPPPPGQKFWGDTRDCQYEQPIGWYEQISQLSSTLDNAALAVLNRKPQYQECKELTGADDRPVGYTWATHTTSQKIGFRNIIAFTTVPLAERYGLSLAKLTSPGPNSRSVGPSGWEGSSTGGSTGVDTLAAALGYVKTDKDTGVVSPDFSIFPYNGAYPGVMPVYAAIPTCGLDPTLADQYADMLTFAADAGQTPGILAGNLPPGYTPLPKVLADYTRTAAKAVRDQTCAVPPPPADPGGAVRDQLGLPAPGTPGSDGSGFPTGAGSTPAGNGAPGAGTTPGSGATPSSKAHRPSTVAATRGSDSWLAGWGLAILLGVGLLAGVAVPLVQIAAQPGHPVRRFFAGTANQTGALLGRTTPTSRRNSP